MSGNQQKFQLEDLNPRPCDIEIELDGKKQIFTLKKFSLRAHMWAHREFGSQKAYDDALNPASDINVAGDKMPYVEGLCKTIHYLMEDKASFPTWEDLAEAIGIGPKEISQIERALMVVMGISQPIIDKADALAKKKTKEQLKKRSAGT